jgi:hypothetical protein
VKLAIFTVLRGSDSFLWGPKQQKAFEEHKYYTYQLPTLSSLERSQSLILYISMSHTTMSRALVQEKETLKDDKKTIKQVLVYLVSKALAGSKRYYSETKKDMLCRVVMSVRKLYHYFEVQGMQILMNQPLNNILGNRDSSRRISKWAMELFEHVIDFGEEVLANRMFWPISLRIG